MAFNVDEERAKWTLPDEILEKHIDGIYGVFIQFPVEKVPQEVPTFALIGGQAGSGKSNLVTKKYEDFGRDAIIIDQDELRPKFPRNFEIDGKNLFESGYSEREIFLILNPHIAKVIEGLIQRAKRDKISIVLESALQDPVAFIRNAQELRAAGYKTELDVMSVPEDEANLSMLTRYCYYLRRDGYCDRNTRINPNALPKLKENLADLDSRGIFDDISVYIRAELGETTPIQIYQKSKNPSETPVQAFERGQQLGLAQTAKTFDERYQAIRSTLEEYSEEQQLEKLEEIKKSFEAKKRKLDEGPNGADQQELV